MAEKEFKNTFFDIFVRKLGLIQELGQLLGYLVTNIFIEKVYRKSALKTSAIALFVLVNSTKQNIKCIKETYVYMCGMCGD